MKHLPVFVLLACSAALTACGGAQDSNANQEKTLASTGSVVVEPEVVSYAESDAGAFAPRGFPEDRAGYQPSAAGSTVTVEN